jgi:hypothetical protein
MRYAEHECSRCHAIVPASRLSKVREQTFSGTSVHKKRFHHGSSYQATGATDRYSVRERWVCGACKRKRAFHIVLLIGTVVGALYVAPYFMRPPPGASSDPSSANMQSADTAEASDTPPADDTNPTTVDDAPAAAVPQAAPVAGPAQQSGEQSTATPVTAPAAAAGLSPSQQIIADPITNDSVAAAMCSAFASGQPERWQAGTLSGYAVPSAPDASGCRMVQVSIDTTSEQSGAVKMCPSG